MKTYILHWLDGKDEEVQGETIREAYMNAGYGDGAIRALDYFEEKKGGEKMMKSEKALNYLKQCVELNPKSQT